MAKKVKGAKAAKDALPRLKTSLYTSPSVTLHLGPNHQIYYLPEVLLQRLENIPSRDRWKNEIHLVDVDPSIGHVLIHFLHTGVYQTLNDEDVEDAENTHKTLVRNEFQTAVLALEAAKKYSVPGLQELAQIELERRGKEMCLRDTVRVIREESIAGPPDEHAWLRDFVSKKARWTFEQDLPMLSAPDFFENIESPTLTRLLAQVVVGLYSEELDKLRKGKTATDKISTPEHSEPSGSCSPNLGQDSGNRPEANAPAALSSCNKEETIELEKRMKEDAVTKERENEKARLREEALAEIQQLGAERGTIAQLQEQDVSVESSVATKDEADKFKVESTWDSWGGAPIISRKRKKGKKDHRAESPPPPMSPPPLPISPYPPSSPLNIQLEVEREEEGRLQCEEEERLEQKRHEREEQERIAAEEERARIEAEEVKAARIAAEEEAAATAAEAETSRKKEDDIWGDWSALSASKKNKKGKKGKTTEPVPPPPLDPPAEPPTTFDDINLDEASAPKIDMNFGDTSANKSGFELPRLGNWTSAWGSSNKDTNAEGDNPWGSSDKKKKDDGFDFDFDAFKNPLAKEKLAKNDGWGGLGATTKTKKKSKKGVLIEDSVPEVPPPPPEPDKKEENDPWGAFGFGSTAKYKKKKKKGVLEEEPPPPELEPEPVVDEPEPAKEEDLWGGGWGAAAADTKKKKGKKGELEPEPEPVLELEPEPEPPKVEVDPYTGLSKSQGKKLKAKLDKEAKLKEEEAAAAAAVASVSSFDSAIETGTTFKDDDCELRSEHLSRDDGWQNCKPCELYMRNVALKLYSVGLPNVNGCSTTNLLG